MRKSNKYRFKYSSRKIKVKSLINAGLILFMFGVVIHDSFVHELPFYYILFTIIGVFIGHIISKTQVFTVKVEKEEKKVLSVKTTPLVVIITITLLGIRFFAGYLLLKDINVIWAADALSLLFIGIYYAKIENFIKQLDEIVYTKYFEDDKPK